MLPGIFLCLATAFMAQAQRTGNMPADSSNTRKDTVKTGNMVITADTVAAKGPKIKKIRPPRDPVKATWMAVGLPGLGQIYNRRYWKLPIVYGAFAGASYFLATNQINFARARNSYRGKILIPGYTVHPDYANYSKEQIATERDYYRRNRDIAIGVMAGVYLLQIVDAVVDAHLSTFDVSNDLSFQVRPYTSYGNVGVQLRF
ncbi:MAG: hypothetical protein IBJ09_06360 [Bacteroidia bacterium]|nr:hypothetical protein [Bacteroidia bacterium]